MPNGDVSMLRPRSQTQDAAKVSLTMESALVSSCRSLERSPPVPKSITFGAGDSSPQGVSPTNFDLLESSLIKDKTAAAKPPLTEEPTPASAASLGSVGRSKSKGFEDGEPGATSSRSRWRRSTALVRALERWELFMDRKAKDKAKDGVAASGSQSKREPVNGWEQLDKELETIGEAAGEVERVNAGSSRRSDETSMPRSSSRAVAEDSIASSSTESKKSARGSGRRKAKKAEAAALLAESLRQEFAAARAEMLEYKQKCIAAEAALVTIRAEARAKEESISQEAQEKVEAARKELAALKAEVEGLKRDKAALEQYVGQVTGAFWSQDDGDSDGIEQGVASGTIFSDWGSEQWGSLRSSEGPPSDSVDASLESLRAEKEELEKKRAGEATAYAVKLNYLEAENAALDEKLKKHALASEARIQNVYREWEREQEKWATLEGALRAEIWLLKGERGTVEGSQQK